MRTVFGYLMLAPLTGKVLHALELAGCEMMVLEVAKVTGLSHGEV